MADINHLVGKWTLIKTDDDTPLEAEERVIEFYKDGSCLVHVKLFGGNSEVSPLFFFYQAFENHTIKFDSGEPGMHLYRFALDGDKLIVKTLAGSEFVFVKEEKKAKAKTRAVAAAAPAKAQKAQEEEFEREPGDNEWKCPKCGKIHQKYVGTCGCGEPKPKEAGPYIPPQEVLDKIKAELEKAEAAAAAEEEVVEEEPKKKADKNAKPERVAGENEWKCPNCGKINQNYVGTCGCGAAKPKPVVAAAPVSEIPDEIPELEIDPAE